MIAVDCTGLMDGMPARCRDCFFFKPDGLLAPSAAETACCWVDARSVPVADEPRPAACRLKEAEER